MINMPKGIVSVRLNQEFNAYFTETCPASTMSLVLHFDGQHVGKQKLCMMMII